jgi:surface protein
MFNGCNKLSSVPLFDTSNVTSMGYMFKNVPLKEVPFFDTTNVTTMSNMFGGSGVVIATSKIKTVPPFNTSKVTDMQYMFHTCRDLESVPLFDTSNVKNMYNMFYSCQSLESVPLFDTSNVTNIGYLFYGCSKLKYIPELDFRSVYSSSYGAFVDCTNVTTCLIKNIKIAIQVNNMPLTEDSLLNLLNETVYTTSTKTLTVGSANLAKFTGEYEYVKLTGKYLDFDDNEVTELTDGQTKIPVVWCSSTDEGAMTVAEYMSSKGWNIA